MSDKYDSFLDAAPVASTVDKYDSFLDEIPDLSNEKINPSVQADIDSATPKAAEPIAAPVEKEVEQPVIEPKKTNLFSDFWQGWKNRASQNAKAIDDNINAPFKMDSSAGNETLQRIGDIGSRIGSTAVNFLDAGTTAPIASAAQTGITDPLFTMAGEGGTQEQKAKLQQASKDTADLLAIASFAPKPLTAVGSTARKADAARELAREQTKTKLQDMGYDVSGLGTKTAQQNTKANMDVAEALGAPKTPIEFADDVALPLTDMQKTVLTNMEMKVRAINGTTPETASGGLNSTIIDNIDAEIKKYEAPDNFNPEKVKQLEAEKQFLIDSNTPTQAKGGTVNQIRKGIDEEIAALEAKKPKGYEAKVKQLQAEKESVTTKRELAPISPSQFENDILVPAAEALDYGVPAKVVQDRMVENLLIANRSPEEITDIVEAVMSNNTRINLGPELKDTLNLTPIQVPRRNSFAIGDYVSTKEGRKLVSAEELDDIFKKDFGKTTAAYVDDFVYQSRISRAYSKKNGNIFGDTENMLKDNTLNRISAVRDTNSNPFQSWIIGDHRGQVNVLVDGIQTVLPDVKPLRRIYDDTAAAGFPIDRAKKLHLAANAMSDIKNMEKQVAKQKQFIAEKTELLKNTTDTHTRKSIQGEIRKAESEIKLLEAKDVYRVDPSNPLSGREQAAKIMSLDGQTDAGKKFLADMKNYSDSLLELAVRGGKITSGEAKAMRESNTNYLYTFRDKLADIPDDLKFGTVKSASKGTASVFKKREGSAVDIYDDPMSAMTMYTAKLTNQAHKAEESYYTLMHNLETLDHKAFNKLFEQDKDLVLEALMGKRDGKGNPITKFDADQLIKDRDPRKPIGEANWTVYTPEGTRLDLTVRPEYSEYTRSLLRPRLYIEPSTLGRITRNIKQSTTNFATTYNPFLQLQFTAASRLGYRASVAKDLRGKGDLAVPLRDVARKMYQDPEFKDYIKRNVSAGALNRSGEGMTRTELAKHEITRSLKNEKGVITNALDYTKKPFLYLEDFADTMDNLNRGKVYMEVKNTLMKEGKMTPNQIELAALNAAKNFEVNYFRQGSSTNWAWRGLVNTIPFMQTGIKGGVKATMAVKHRPKEVATAIGMLAGAEFAINSYNAQFTDEKGVPYYSYVDPALREKYILMGWPGMSSPSHFFKIRRPFNLARVSGGSQEAAFNILNKAATNYLETADTETRKALEESPIFKPLLLSGQISSEDVTAIILNQMTADFDPTRYSLQNVSGFGVLGEMAMNRQDFEVPIVPDQTSSLAQYQQVAPGRTSQLAYNFTRYLADRKVDISPTMATYFIENIYGNLGKHLLGAADVIYAHSSGKELPETAIESYPGISSFSTLREVPPTGIKSMYARVNGQARGVVDEYKKELAEAKKGTSGSLKKAQKLLVENKETIDYYLNVVEPINKQIAELNTRRTQLLGMGKDRRPDDTTPEQELSGDPILRDKLNSINEDIQNLQAIALDELYTRKDELKDLYNARNKLSLPAKLIKGLYNAIPEEKPVDKPVEKEYNVGPQSNLETYDDSNPPSMQEQSGMDLQTVDYAQGSPSVYELFLEQGAKTFDPKDVKIAPKPEEPVDPNKFFKENFPNIEKKFPGIKQLETKAREQKDYYAKLAFVESSNNPNAKAKTSSARGMYQFTTPTWNMVVKKWGKEHGLTKSGLFSHKQQEVAIRLLTEDNKKRLAAKLNVPENRLGHTELYAAHFLGVNGAAKLLSTKYTANAAKTFPEAAKANKSIFYDEKGKPRTVKEVILVLEKKMNNA